MLNPSVVDLIPFKDVSDSQFSALEQLEEVLYLKYKHIYAHEAWTISNFLMPLPSKFNTSFLVCTMDQIIGFSVAWQVSPSSFHISRLGIHPGYSGQGIASMLLSHQELRFMQHGAKSCSIECTPSNHRASSLYRKLGFVQMLCHNEINSYCCERSRSLSDYSPVASSSSFIFCKRFVSSFSTT